MTLLASWLSFLFYTGNWPRRWNCGNWSTALGYTSIISELLIWAAYWTVGFLIVYFLKKQTNRFLRRISWMFAVFFFLCGITHLCEAIIFYYPFYRFLALMLVVTASFSWVGILIILPLVKETLSMPDQLIHQNALKQKFEESIRANEIAAEVMGAGVFTWDLNENRFMPSERFCKILKLNVNTANIKTFEDFLNLIDEKDRTSVRLKLDVSDQNTNIQTTTLHLIDSEEKVHYCVMNWKILYDAHHYPVQIIGIIFPSRSFFKPST